MLDAVVSTAALPCPGIELNVEIDVYSFMTTAPNALTDSINHERMPVLLQRGRGVRDLAKPSSPTSG